MIRASPPEGTTQQTTFPITLIVSRGKEQVKVPNEKGKPQADAILDLHNAGLRYGLSQMASSEPAGTVIAQSPAAGTKVAKRTVVTLTIAIGVPVPDVVGATQLTAKNQLAAAGLTVSVETEIVHDPGENLPGPGAEPVRRGRSGAQGDDGHDHGRPVHGRGNDDDDDVDHPAATTPAHDAGHDADHDAMRVAVLRGGRSSEHEVSLASGASVADGLRGAGP